MSAKFVLLLAAGLAVCLALAPAVVPNVQAQTVPPDENVVAQSLESSNPANNALPTISICCLSDLYRYAFRSYTALPSSSTNTLRTATAFTVPAGRARYITGAYGNVQGWPSGALASIRIDGAPVLRHAPTTNLSWSAGGGRAAHASCIGQRRVHYPQ